METNNLHKVCNVSVVEFQAGPDRMRVLISFDNLFHYAASLTVWLSCPACPATALIIVILNYKLHFHQDQQLIYRAIQCNQISPQSQSCQSGCSINIHLFILLPAVISPSSFTSQSGFNPILRNNRRQRGERRFSYFDLQLTTSSPVFSGD